MAVVLQAEQKHGRYTTDKGDTPAPEPFYLTALKSWLESAYQEQDDELDALRRNRDLEDEPIIPEWMDLVPTRVQDPAVRIELSKFVAALSMRWPTVAVTPGEPGSDFGQEYSTELEHFIEELFKVASQRVPGQDQHVRLLDGCAEGGGWTKWILDWHRWEPVFRKAMDDDTDDDEVENEKKRRGPPLTRIAVDTATVYPVWEDDRLAEMMEISHHQTYPLLRKYDLTIESDGTFGERLGRPLSQEESERYPSSIEMVEHWTSEWVSYSVHSGKSSRMLKQIRHGYGQVPYFFAPGLLHNYMNDRKIGQSVASHMLKLTQFRSFLLTSEVQYAAMQAAAPMFQKQAPTAESMTGEGEDRDPTQVSTYDIPYGSVIRGGTEDDLKPIPHPGIPDGLDQVLSLVTSLQQSSQMPNLQGGPSDSGYATQVWLTEAKARFRPFIANIERCMEQEAYFVLGLIQNKIKETVFVRRSLAPGQVVTPAKQWIGIGPKDIQEAVGVRWTLDPEPAASKIVESRFVLELVQGGLMSLDQAMAYLNLNPDEVREGKSMDRMRNEPWYTKFYDEQLLRKLRRYDIMRKAAEGLAQGGVLPGMDPMLAGMAQQNRGGFGPPMAQPAQVAPGAPIIPDQGALAAAPGGGAAIPQGGSPYQLIGANAGIGPGAVLPQAGMQAGVQTLGPGM